MRADLQVIGLQAIFPRRIAASATRYEVGEPLYSAATLTSGVASSNTWVLAAADFVINGTNWFGGIATEQCQPFETGTVVAHETKAACPVPMIGRIRGKAETAASVDTDSELLGLLNDVTRIDYAATGASDGGELYTIKEVAAQDTDLLMIVDGNIRKGTLDVVVDAVAYRIDNDYS